jgi:hypothetical protein
LSAGSGRFQIRSACRAFASTTVLGEFLPSFVGVRDHAFGHQGVLETIVRFKIGIDIGAHRAPGRHRVEAAGPCQRQGDINPGCLIGYEISARI